MIGYEFRSKGERIFSTGDKDDKMYVIIDGDV